MAYTTINKHTEHFNTKLYTGNFSARSITGVGFQPDLVWIKKRSGVDSNVVHDVLRGATKYIYTDSNNPEATFSGGLTSFDSDGYSLGVSNFMNENNYTFASWNWKANGQGSANSDGTITTTYTSANTTAGFSIIKYTGNGTAGATVGHGLNSAPEFVITKKLSASANWQCWGSVIGNVNLISLNTTSAKSNPNGNYNNDTNPSSTVVTLGNDNDINQNGEPYVMYCFHSVKGYSKIGTYTGNGNSDGTFIYTGFKPAWILAKASSRTGRWRIWDVKRSTFNVTDKMLDTTSSDAEITGATEYIDILSNGFKFRTSEGQSNGSGETNIYMAFGQSLVGSNNVPCTAR